MPRHIVKLTTPIGDRYIEWSTVTDSPLCYGMTREEFDIWYLREYRRQQGETADQLRERMARVDRFGTSCMSGTTPERLLAGNRAGHGDTTMTMEQIVDYYCVRRGKGEYPKGAAVRIDTDKQGSAP